LVEESSTLDDVLNLQVTDLLSRRLQTVVLKKFSFKTPYQARQAIVHGHIMIGDRIVNVPSYVVGPIEEKQVSLAPNSSLSTLVEQLEKSKAEQPPAENDESQPKEEGKMETTEQPKEQSSVKETKVENSSTKLS
jgi:small subunit ribosomal protein S4